MPSGARGFLVLADGEPEIADAAANEEVAEHEDERSRSEDHIVEHRRRAAQQPQIVVRILLDRQEQAARRIDEAPIVEADAGELGEGDGQDGEINAGNAEAEGEIADDRAAGGGDRNGGEEAEPWADAEAGEQHRRDITGKPDIERMAERKLPGEAHHDVPGLPGIGEIQNEDEDGEQIIVDQPRRGHERRQQRQRAARRARRETPADRPDDHARLITPASGRECPAGGTAAPAREWRRRTCS